MKVIKKKNPSIFWLPTGTCCKYLEIIHIFKNQVNEGRKFHKIPVHLSKSYFQVKKCEKNMNK